MEECQVPEYVFENGKLLFTFLVGDNGLELCKEQEPYNLVIFDNRTTKVFKDRKFDTGIEFTWLNTVNQNGKEIGYIKIIYPDLVKPMSDWSYGEYAYATTIGGVELTMRTNIYRTDDQTNTLLFVQAFVIDFMLRNKLIKDADE